MASSEESERERDLVRDIVRALGEAYSVDVARELGISGWKQTLRIKHVLARLEDAGILVSRKAKAGTGLGRRYYRTAPNYEAAQRVWDARRKTGGKHA